mmetsp:Transcript_38290/g.56398  ORF Transcript_38290/g.56398 Transcript_38290/m.56398 type:complete len:246 (+) Transcript_38290:1041-1778(+)
MLPFDVTLDDPNRLHSSRGIVKLTELHSNLLVYRKKCMLTFRNSSLYFFFCTFFSILQIQVKRFQFFIKSVHSNEKVLRPVLDARRTISFQHPTTRCTRRSIHLHYRCIDRSIKYNPGPTSNLSKWWNEHKYWLLICNKSINNLRSIFKNFIKHIPLSSTKSPPVGKYYKGQVFHTKVIYCLGCFECTIWKPDTTGFLNDSFGCRYICRISGLNCFCSSIFRYDYTHGDTTKASPSYNYTLCPSS